MASTGTRAFVRARGWVRAFVGRIIRRGFFRIVLLLFLVLFVLPFVALQVAANKSSGNRLMHEVVSRVFNTNNAQVTWDEDRTEFTGPSIALTGSITYYNLKVARKQGGTPHPSGEILVYDFLSVPKVQIDYDLKRLPDLPITTVRIESGLVLYFNIHKGDWIDEDLFVTGTGADAAELPALPNIITGGVCEVKIRADGVLAPPGDVMAGAQWYDMVVKDLTMLPSPQTPDTFTITGLLASPQFGKFNIGGNVGRRAQHVDVLLRSADPIKFDRNYASVLDPAVRNTVEQFQITADADLEASLAIEPGKDLQFTADIRGSKGSICWVGFPEAVRDCTADIQVRNNDITVDAIGRRGGADVRVTAKIDDAGTTTEIVQVNVDIRNLLVDEEFRLALLPARLQPDNLKNWNTGMPYSEEEWDPLEHIYFDEDKQAFVDGYPEWQGPPPWRGGTLFPDIASALPFICRAFTPLGLADFQLRFDQEMKGRDPVTKIATLDQKLNWKVFVHDATAAYTGLPENPTGAFPVALHGAYGVVEGNSSTAAADSYIVRGYTVEELAMLGLTSERGFQAWDKKGLTGTLKSETERLWIYAIYQEPRDPGEQPTLDLVFESDGLEFGDELKTRMPQNIRDVVDQFAPAGKVDIQRARVTIKPEGDADIDYAFTLTAKDVIAQYKFPNAAEPARFREISGTVRIESTNDRVELINLRGELLGSPVTISLSYLGGDVPSFAVESDDFEVRPELIDVLPRELGAALKRFDPRGYIKFSVSGSRFENEPSFTDAEIEFVAGSGDRSGSVSFDGFPYAITDVTGRFLVSMTDQWTTIVIRDFSGRGSELPGQTSPSTITINGSVLVPVEAALEGEAAEGEAPEGETPEDDPIDMLGVHFDLQVNATRVPVDSALMAAFTGMFAQPDSPEKPQLVTFVESLNVGGTIGTSGRLVGYPDGELAWLFEILLEGTSVNFSNFPYPIEGLYGSLLVDGTDVSLRNVEGQVESGKLHLHNASYSEDEGWSLTISARDLDFQSPVLRKALPEGLRDVVKRLNPQGGLDLDLELSGKDDYMHYQLSLDIFETDIELGLKFEKMTARFDMEGAFEGEGSRQNGSVFVKEVFFKDARFNDITTAVQYFGDRVEFPNLRGRFYDGWLEGRFGIDGDKYSGEIEIRAADLSQLGKTAFPGAGELLGALDAEVMFHSDVDRNGQIGRGRVDIQPFDRDSDDPKRNSARLLEVPLFNQIARVTGDESNFDEGHVFFWLGSDRITIREMDFVSNAARVETFGGDEENYIMYDTGLMRLKLFFTLAPRSPIPLPILQDVLDLLKQILFPLFVTGSLNKPDVQAFSLTAEDLEDDEFPRRPRGQ